VPDALAADKSEGDNDDDAVHLLTYPAREDSAAAVRNLTYMRMCFALTFFTG
jgi:hypothetical protein